MNPTPASSRPFGRGHDDRTRAVERRRKLGQARKRGPVALARLAGKALLLALLGVLALASFAPGALSWRLVSNYVAIPAVSATVETTVVLSGSGPQVEDVRSIAVDQSGALFIAQGPSGRLLVFPRGLAGAAIAFPGPDAADSPQATALAVGPDQTLHVLDSVNGTLSQLTTGGNLLRSDQKALYGATALAIDDELSTYVALPRRGLILKFDSDGQPDLGWGDRPGTASVANVDALAVTGDRLYAATGTDILELDRRGRVMGAHRPVVAPSKLAAGPDGQLFVADARSARIWLRDPQGSAADRRLRLSDSAPAYGPSRGLAVAGDRLYAAVADRVSVYHLPAALR